MSKEELTGKIRSGGKPVYEARSRHLASLSRDLSHLEKGKVSEGQSTQISTDMEHLSAEALSFPDPDPPEEIPFISWPSRYITRNI